MSWVKFDDLYSDHPKVVEVGPLGMALHMAATCYCARYMTDGFVPAAMLARLINFDGIYTDCNGECNAVTVENVTDQLVRTGLLEIVDGGYVVHDYLDYNPSSSKVKAEKAATAERVARFRGEKRVKRECNAVTNANVTPTPSPSPYPIKDDDEDDGSEPLPQFTKLYKLYEKEIGVITPIIADKLDLAEKDYPQDWIEEAFRAAVTHNARNWSYIEAVLRGMKEHGTASPPQRNGATPTPAQPYRPRGRPDTSAVDRLIESGV